MHSTWGFFYSAASSKATGEQMAKELTYIAGPMSGVPEFNYPAFAEKAYQLRQTGVAVISPHELHPADPTIPWDWYLRRDLTELLKCSQVVLLPGWENSPGAQLEHHVATALGMRIIYPGETA